MDYITTKETSVKWGLSHRRIQSMCISGAIEGAMKFGREWAIPKDAERPSDRRVRSGKYIKKLEIDEKCNEECC